MVFVYTAPKVLIAERVAPRYDPDLAVIYSARRLLAAGTELRLYTTGDTYGVYVEDDDMLPSAAETVIEAGFNTSVVKDHDDETYAIPASDLAAGESRDHARWDLGSLADRVVVAKLYSSSPLRYARVMVSADGATWVNAVVCESATCLAAYRGSFRYLKLRSENADTLPASAYAFRYYSVEVYTPNLRKVLVSTADVYKLVRVVSKGGSQVLELTRAV